jgi:type IX secretion system PorP/SprF family membrane protein
MKIRFLIAILLFLRAITIFGQSNIRVNNYWDNTYYINPASIHDQYNGEISMAARTQWVNFPGSPSTFFAHGSVYLPDFHTQVGIKAMADKIGYTNTYDVDFSYAYSLSLYPEWKLNMGLTLNYQGLNYDLSQINLTNGDDPSAYEHFKFESNFNSNLGVELNNKYWRIGLAGQNIFSLFNSFSDLFNNTNFLYASFQPYSRNFFSVGGGMCVIQYGNMMQAELNFNSFFKMTPENNAFQLGLFYRTWHEGGMLFGIDLTNSFHLAYSYDYNAGAIRRNSIGTHELILTYKIKGEPKCVNCWY